MKLTSATCAVLVAIAVLTLTDAVTVKLGGYSGNQLVVTVNGKTGNVCKGQATNAVARVVCLELGLNPDGAQLVTPYFKPYFPFVMDELRCSWDALSLANCVYDAVDPVCNQRDSVTIKCGPEPPKGPPNITVAIEGGGHSGRLLATIDGVFTGTVAFTYYQIHDVAEVVCRELGWTVNRAKVLKLPKSTDLPVALNTPRCTGTERRLSDCRYNVGRRDGYTMGVDCSNVSIAIAGGGNNGTLLVTLNGITGLVCKDTAMFGAPRVVCRELGLNTTWAHWRPATTQTALPIVVNAVLCFNRETKFLDCSFGPGNCTASQGIDVICPSARPDISVAIEGGGTKGRVLVTMSGQAVPFCIGYRNNIAEVVCRELGFNTTMPILTHYYGRYMSGVIGRVRCFGNETRLAQCNYSIVSGCSTFYEINCSPAPTNVTVTIEGGGHTGRLLAIVDGQVGTVCNVETNDALLAVVCRELGWNTTRAQLRSVSPGSKSDLPVTLRDVSCTGHEGKLFDCAYLADNRCSRWREVEVDCSPAPVITVATERGARKGRLVVTVDGQKGTVCNTGATNTMAMVACRQLGWDTPLARIKKVKKSSTSMPIVMDNVVCTGNESSLRDCKFSTYNTSSNSCTHSQDVGIDCSAAPVNVVVTIAGGGSKGRVFAIVDGVNGTVCDDGATHVIAKVVCRELGFNSSWPRIYRTPRTPDYYWKRNPLPMMDDVRCAGNESSLGQCSYTTVHNCIYTEDVGVDCSDEYGPVSDVMVTADEEGYLYAAINGTEGHVRMHGATEALAASICRELGFNTTTAAISLAPSDRCEIYNVVCTGKESSLTECTFVTANDCLQSMVAKIRCAPVAPDHRVPLNVTVAMEGNGPMGRLIATVNGRSGIIRINTPSNAIAAVVCRELGWNTTIGHLRKFVIGRLDYVLADVTCRGNESRLADCAYTYTNESSTRYYRGYNLGVDCSPDLTVSVGRVGTKRKARVIAKVNGVSGYVCRTGATDAMATVVCRELGYNASRAQLIKPGRVAKKYALPWLPIVMHEVYCTGHESTLANCTFTIFNECQDDPVEIACSQARKIKVAIHSRKVKRSVATSKRNKRAVSSLAGIQPTMKNFKRQGDKYRGRLLANVDGKVGSICYKGAARRSVALVVCRELGQYTPRARLIKMSSEGKWPIRAEISSCTGNETRLSDCTFYEHGRCRRENDIGVLCYPVPKFSIEGGGSRGRLLATNNFMKGTVCDRIANEGLARVVCRELGYTKDKVEITKLSKESLLPIMLDDANCIGSEDRVADCTYTTPDTHCYSKFSSNYPRYTYDSRDLEINCLPGSTKVTNVAIEGGGRKGRLLVTVDGKTGTVCNDRATHALAAVACREMGLDTPTARITSVLTPSTLPIVMNEVRCKGNERKLAKCSFVTISNCNHIEDVGVDCSPGPVMTGVAIDGGGREGRLLVTVNGQTGTVCDDLATHAVAKVVCRELGLDTNKPRITRPRASNTTFPIVMDEVQCTGNETSLSECVFLTSHNCDHSEDIAVRCPHIKE